MEQKVPNTVVSKSETAKKLNLWKIFVFPLALIMALLVIAVIVIAFLPMVRLTKVGGVFYATVDGEIDQETYYKLQAGRWTMTDGSRGQFNLLGGELILDGQDSSQQTLHYHARIENGLFIIEDGEQEKVFVSESHEHAYSDDWVKMENVGGELVPVERLSDCEKGGVSAQYCACGVKKTERIPPKAHAYYTETVKRANCGESGLDIRRCAYCDWTYEMQTPVSGQHLTFIDGKCTVCGMMQLRYELSRDGTHYIVMGLGNLMTSSSTISIAETYEGLPVTEVAANAFNNLNAVFSYEIPASITKIGEGAFRGCLGFTTITVAEGNPVYHSAYNCLIETESKTLLCGYTTSQIPDDGSVTKIAAYAFTRNDELRSIEIPDCVTEIGANAFKGCIKLKSAKLPSGLKTIPEYLFNGCSVLESVTIQDGVERIGSNVFYNCKALKRISIPQSVTSMGTNLFVGCINLLELTVKEGNPVYHSSDNCIIHTASKTLTIACDPFTIPADGSVTRIEYYAFSACTTMTRIVIPRKITKIDTMAFYGCTALRSITVEDRNPVYHSAGNCIIETATSTLYIGCMTSIIPNDGSVTKIGSHAFYACAGLESIAIPGFVTKIGAYAFSNCSALKGIEIPNSVKEIGGGAFEGCREVQTIFLCSGLSFPDRPTPIYSSGYGYRLETIHFSGTMAEWREIEDNFDFYPTHEVIVSCTDGVIKIG